MAEYKTRVLIIGSGPAGATAAIYAARANLGPIMINGLAPGGQLTITTDVENYPGFADPINGPWLMEQMLKQVENVGAQCFFDHIEHVDLSKRPFMARGMNGDLYISDVVVIATGAQARWLGIESEEKYKGYGVSGCATCDGFFFKNKNVIVVGGGNAAVEEAIYLTNHAASVTVIHRRDSFRAEKVLQDRLFKNPKIRVMWDSVLDEVVGTDMPKTVTGAKIKNLRTNIVEHMDIDGIFVAIGHTPNTALFKDYVNIDSDGYIVTAPNSTKTNIDGVFACGDVQDKIFRQAVTSAGTGCMAALEAEKYLSD